MMKLKNKKPEQQVEEAPRSKHISAKDIRYLNPTERKKKETVDKKEFDKQLETSTSKLMFNLKLMLGLYIFLLVFNIAAPLYVSMEMAYKSLFQIAICVVHTYNILSAWGWFKHKFASVWWLLIRAAEAFFYIFLRSGSINWVIYGLLLVGDTLFLAIFLYDNSVYEEVDKPIN